MRWLVGVTVSMDMGFGRHQQLVMDREACVPWFMGSQSRTQLSDLTELISFRMDWLDLLAVQGTLKSLLQHQSSKASFLWHSAFLTVQLSHPYMTSGKTIALTRQTFVGKVMSLLFNIHEGNDRYYLVLPVTTSLPGRTGFSFYNCWVL